MNQREKFLIIVLAAVVILLGGFKLLIEPQMKKVAEVKVAYAQAGSDKQKIEQNKLQASIIEKNNTKLENEILNNSATFFPEIETNRIHIFFQNMADAVHIKYESFNMTSKAITQVDEHLTEDTGTSYPAKDAADGINEINQSNTYTEKKNDQNTEQQADQTAGSKQPSDLIEMMTVSLQFKGSYQQGLALVDQINSSKRMVRISSLDMSLNDQDQLVISITAECFGIVKTSSDILSSSALPQASGKSDPFQD
jgi:Tfp pilus assembly protein PilO